MSHGGNIGCVEKGWPRMPWKGHLEGYCPEAVPHSDMWEHVYRY